MTCKELIFNKRTEVSTNAENINAWYVMCAFISPLNHEVSFRVGYFDERYDAEQWISTLVSRYNKLKASYYIVSNTTEYHIGNNIKEFLK